MGRPRLSLALQMTRPQFRPWMTMPLASVCMLRMLCSDCRLWLQELQGCLPAWMVQAGLPGLHSTCPGGPSSVHWYSCWISFSLHGDRGVRANHDDLVWFCMETVV